MNILETSVLLEEDIIKLTRGDHGMIIARNYYDHEICTIIAEKLDNSVERGSFTKAKDISRIGMAHFDIVSNDTFDKYHANAIRSINELRRIFQPYLSPIDKLRLNLEEIWSSGTHLETLYGKKCFVGICRIIAANVSLDPHTDRLDRDSPDSYQAKSLLSQLSANIYMQVPEKGGALELWPHEPDEDEYKKMKSSDHYGVSRELLGSPALSIRPEPGDLILFNPRKFHAVSEGKGQDRICIGAFIGYRGDNQPLSYWS